MSTGFSKGDTGAIAPFKAHSQDDIAYLQAGIADLLPSRIAVPGKISVIDNYVVRNEFQLLAPDHPASAEVAAAEKLEADFLLSGSLIKIGSNISLETRLIEVSAPEKSTPLSLQSLGLDEMLPQITVFAERIKKRILGVSDGSEETVIVPPKIEKVLPKEEEFSIRPSVAPTPVTPASITPAPVTTASAAPAPVAAAPAPPPAVSPSPPPEPEKKASEESVGKRGPLFERTPFYSCDITGEEIRCITAGDLDGDGKMELLLSGEHRILVYQWVAGALQLRDEIRAGYDEHIVHIDTGDVNGNGRDEIYVSSFGVQAPNSFVLERKDGTYVRIENSQEWFFRTYRPQGKELLLLGQKAGEAKSLSNNIFTFGWKEGKLISRAEYLTPKSFNLYAFADGKLNGDGRWEYVAFNKGFLGLQNQLTIFSNLGRMEWRDLQKMGGDVNYFVKRLYGNDLEQQEFIPLRILCGDYRRDGRSEVIVGRNSTKAAGFLKKLAQYDQGEVLCLSWEGSDLIPNWSSGLLPGYVSDYGVFDLDGDGKLELFAISVSQTGLLENGKNRLTVFRQAQPH